MAQVSCNTPPATLTYIVGDETVVYTFTDTSPQTIPDDVVPLIDEDEFTVTTIPGG